MKFDRAFHNNKVYLGTDCTAILFNFIKSSKP